MSCLTKKGAGCILIRKKESDVLCIGYNTVWSELCECIRATHSRQCCNLLIAWLWTQPVIVLLSVARECDDQSTVHLDWQLGGYNSARVRNIWGINRVLLRISIWFSCQFAGFHVANRAAIDVCYYYADVWSVLAHFGSEYSCERPSTGRSGQVDSVFMSHFSWRDRWPSAVRAQPCLLQRLLGLDLSPAVHWCVTHCRQTVCSELRPVITLQTQCWRNEHESRSCNN